VAIIFHFNNNIIIPNSGIVCIKILKKIASIVKIQKKNIVCIVVYDIVPPSVKLYEPNT